MGTMNMIEEVIASCRYWSAQKLIPVISTNISARRRCQRQWLVMTSRFPRSGKSRAEASTACIRKRSQTTTITGRRATSHFAVPSSSVKSR